MNSLSKNLLCATILLSVLLFSGRGLCQDPPPAADLIRTVLEQHQSRGFRARARVETFHLDGTRSSAQITLKGRRDGPRTRILIAALWPANVKGSGVMIDRRTDRQVSGFMFGPNDAIWDLKQEMLDEELFATAIRPSDFVQPFWYWPEQEIIGSEMAGREESWILLSRPQAGRPSPSVRSAVSKDKFVPIHIEFFGIKGEKTAVIYFQRLARREGGVWSPVSFTVEIPPSGRRTSVEFSRGERDIEIPESEFEKETFRQFLIPGR